MCWLMLLAVPAVAAASLSWSGPQAVDPQAAGIPINRVACPATNQCTAVDSQGQEVTFNPQAPQNPTTVVISSHALSGVACPATIQCTAVDISGQEVTFNPQSSAGGTAVAIDSGGIPLGLACPSAALCTTVDANGQAVGFNPQSSKTLASAAVDPGRILVGVDCPGSSTTQCAAIDSSGGAVLYNPQAPSSQAPTQIDGTANASPSSVACRSNKCVLVDNVGTAYTFGTQGATPQPQGSGPIDQTNAGVTAVSGVACPSDAQCTAIDVHGAAAPSRSTGAKP